MEIANLTQGSPEWHAHRKQFLNASDAPAMMGCSSYTTRSELIKRLATGIVPEVDAATQRRFDDGHLFEDLARPLAETIIGEELAPLVGTSGKFSASFDGLTLMGDIAFEHKSLNDRLRAAFDDIETIAPDFMMEAAGKSLPMEYQVQMEQQAMVSECERILFMASKWKVDPETGDYVCEEKRHCWYTPNPELRAKVVAGWAQLEQDVAAYDTNAEPPTPVVAAPIESLPAVAVQIQGALAVVSNLDKFGDALRGFIGRMVPKPSTDQEFADAEAECKTLKKAEDMLDAAEDSALAQISDVEQLRRIKADLKTLARSTRLAREKVVTAEKESRRKGLVMDAQKDLDSHTVALNKRLGANWMPYQDGVFGEVIRGMKSLDSMRDKIVVALTNAKVDANTLADLLEANRKHLVQEDSDWITLFPDFATVGTKASEDFQALAALRIDRHKQAEAARLEAQREQIRAEEAAKLQREAEAKERAEAEAAAQAQQEADRINQLAADAAANDATDTVAQVEQPQPEEVANLPLALEVQAPAAIKTAAEKLPIEQRVEAGQTMTLGTINSLLGIFDVKASTLAALGIATEKHRGAVHIDICDFGDLCLSLMVHIDQVRAQYNATKKAA